MAVWNFAEKHKATNNDSKKGALLKEKSRILRNKKGRRVRIDFFNPDNTITPYAVTHSVSGIVVDAGYEFCVLSKPSVPSLSLFRINNVLIIADV